jgi:hypothetical protein
LYINYETIKDDITNDNCFNLDGKQLAHDTFVDDDNILTQFVALNKKYVVLKQFWSLNKFKNLIDSTIYKNILPSKRLIDLYNAIKINLINKPYNCIHYRHEIDFTSYFKIEVENLDSLIEKIKFKNNELNIYIATTNIKKLLNLSNEKYKNIIYKDEDLLSNLNFEENAFIDYMFCINSQEFYGHNLSSFSQIVNIIKNTGNYYTNLNNNNK